MKCTNSKKRFFSACLACMMLLCFSGCAGKSYSFPYDAEYGVSSFQIVQTVNASSAVPFANDLCIVGGDVSGGDVSGGDAGLSAVGAALLCDVNTATVLYAQNVHERMHPASLTKVMTALVALKYGSMDQILTATSDNYITERGAVLLGLKAGDTMTLSQALYILLVYSANDVGMLIAEGVGGSVEGFVELMNEEAKALGATNTHFMNPHGLTEDNHYTTAYDLYLIFNEAIKYETFREIIHTRDYSTVYYDKDGNSKEFSKTSTNLYFRGNFEPPENITIVGGKTGTTDAAGHCLILLSRDTAGAPYISVILRAPSNDVMYPEMSDLLNEIGK